MRDMVPPDRSIRNIPVPAAHHPKGRSSTTERRQAAAREEYFEPAPRIRRQRTGRRWFMWVAIGVITICAIAGLLLSTLFAGATVTVFARSASVTPPASLPAYINPSPGNLGYTSMTVTSSATATVTASGSKAVSRPASGVITIYNAFGTASQRLIANTRFEAPDGKIYRIHESVTVPGATKQANDSLTPGSTSATLYADSPGASYNRGATRFTIPGFKDDPRYSTFYAEAQSITGGFVGNEAAVSPADLTKAQNDLRQGLQSSLNSSITSQIPDGFIPVSGAFDLTYTDISQTPGTGNNVLLAQSATAVAAMVRVTDLSAAIASKSVQGYNGEAVSIPNISQVTLSVASTTKPVGVLTLQISGSPTLVWQYDPAAIKQALLGKKKSDFEAIITTFHPALTGAEAKVRPFWQGSFPSDPNKITIVVGVPK